MALLVESAYAQLQESDTRHTHATLTSKSRSNASRGVSEIVLSSQFRSQYPVAIEKDGVPLIVCFLSRLLQAT